jgi:hypothetical protein
MKPKISFSGRGLLHSCARRFRLNGEYHKPWFRPSVELGTGFHKLQDLTLTAEPRRIISDYTVWRGITTQSISGRITAEEMEKLHQEHDKAVPLWEAYWQVSPSLCPRIAEVLASEHSFMLELPECYVPGKIDQIVIVDNPWYGSIEPTAVKPDQRHLLAVLDFKTTSQDITIYTAGLLKSSQGPIYLQWAKSDAFKRDFPEVVEQYGEPVGVIYDVIGVPAIRLKKKETWDDFLARYKAEILSDIPSFFLRTLQVPSYNCMTDTSRGFAADARLLQSYRDTGYFPKNDKSCVQHSKLCEYADECDAVTECSTDPPSQDSLVQVGETNVENTDDE